MVDIEMVDIKDCIKNYNHNHLILYSKLKKIGYRFSNDSGKITLHEEVDISSIHNSLVCLRTLNIIIIGGAILDIERMQYPEVVDIERIISFYRIKGFNVKLEIYDAADFSLDDSRIKYNEFLDYKYENNQIYNFHLIDFKKEYYDKYKKDYNLIFAYQGATAIGDMYIAILPNNINNTTYLFPMGCGCGKINYLKMIKYLLDDEDRNYYDIYKKNYYDILYLVNNYRRFTEHICSKYLQIHNPDEEDKYIFKNYLDFIKNTFITSYTYSIRDYISSARGMIYSQLNDNDIIDWWYDKNYINSNIDWKRKYTNPKINAKFKLFFMINNLYILYKLKNLELPSKTVEDLTEVYTLLEYKNKELDLKNFDIDGTISEKGNKFIAKLKDGIINLDNKKEGIFNIARYSLDKDEFITALTYVYDNIMESHFEAIDVTKLLSLCDPIDYIK